MKTFYYTLVLTFFSYASLSAQWNTNGDDIYITTGKIGIGFSVPSEIIHIKSPDIPNLRLGHDVAAENYTGDLGGIIIGKHFDTRDVAKIYGYTDWAADSFGSADLRFATARYNVLEDHMVIKSNGDIGIGTLTPDAKLAVNGTVHAKEVQVDINGWSDFVFKPDYILPTLDEVEAHIKEKGHLKDIPSEAEVRKNSIRLGEMDAKLLQKIEELTLYTVQQQKEIKVLKKENKALKSLSERLTAIETKMKSKKQ